VIGWTIGLGGVSLLAGSICSYFVWLQLHSFFERTAKKKRWGVKKEATERIPIQPILIGVLERLFFTILVAFEVSGVASGLTTWIVVKMVSGWNRYAGGDETWRRMLAFNGLINTLVSLLFAIIGGLIANGTIPLIYGNCQVALRAEPPFPLGFQPRDNGDAMDDTEQALKALEFFKDWSNYLLVTTVAALGWASTEKASLTSARAKQLCIWLFVFSIACGIFTLAMIPLVAQQTDGMRSIFSEGVTFNLLWLWFEVGPITLKWVCWPQHLFFMFGVIVYAWGTSKRPA
jgi:hypothetical protein